MDTKRTNITLVHNTTSWTHLVDIVQGELIYQSPEANVYYHKECKCSKASWATLAHQATIAVQGVGLNAGLLRGVG